MTLKILLADDHQLLREGLRGLLSSMPDYEVVGEAEDGRTAVRLAQELSPDLVIIDVSMPGLNGIEATRQIVASRPSIRILALSMHCKKETVVEILRAGASGYLVKMSSFDEVTAALETVASGRRYLSPNIAGAVVDELLNPGQAETAFTQLTPREREILQLLAEGENSEEIADTLQIGVRTVDVHRKNLMDKLQLKSIAQLTIYAVRQGLVSIED